MIKKGVVAAAAAATAAKLLQSCPTLCDPMDSSPPGSSVHRILQARILEWVAVSFSRGSSWPRDQTCVSCLDRQILSHWATWEAPASSMRDYRRDYKHLSPVDLCGSPDHGVTFVLVASPLNIRGTFSPCLPRARSSRGSPWGAVPLSRPGLLLSRIHILRGKLVCAVPQPLSCSIQSLASTKHSWLWCFLLTAFPLGIVLLQMCAPLAAGGCPAVSPCLHCVTLHSWPLMFLVSFGCQDTSSFSWVSSSGQFILVYFPCFFLCLSFYFLWVLRLLLLFRLCLPWFTIHPFWGIGALSFCRISHIFWHSAVPFTKSSYNWELFKRC